MIDDMKRMRGEGMSYAKIAIELGVSKSTVIYHLHPERREGVKLKRRNQPSYGVKKKNYILANKLSTYKSAFKDRKVRGKVNNVGENFSYKDVLSKFVNPTSYLTGCPIDFDDSSSYVLDHVIPVSKGGLNTLDNLEIASPLANQMKWNMTVDELLVMCENILKHHGRM